MRLVAAIILAAATYGASTDSLSCQRKFDEISSERLRPGTRVTIPMRELNAWVADAVPAGVRETKVSVPSDGVAVGSALVDFARLESGQGHRPGWLMQKLLEGERPVRVTARIRSGGGECTVDVQRVEIADIQIDGNTLQFLLDHFLLAMYPDAKVGRPFELEHHMEKLDVQPAAVTVVMGR
jgi:hypothetical protein